MDPFFGQAADACLAGRTMIRVARQTGVPAGYHEAKGIFQLGQNIALFKGAGRLFHLGGYFFDGLVLGGRGAFGSAAHGLVRLWLIKLLDQSGPFLLRALAMAEMALSVVLSLPERMACRVPGTAFSATSTLLAKVSARSTVLLLTPYSAAMRSQVALPVPFNCSF